MCGSTQNIGRASIPPTGHRMNIYPADERRISEVERGRSCEAIAALPPGRSLAAGDTIVFALALSHEGGEPRYVKGGDSVRVLLTGVTDIGATDPVTGRALFQLTWEPLGQGGPPDPVAKRALRFHARHGIA
jgi:hypothetical protein